ncbi:MAG: hypothetical protein LBJ96_00220 [Holosporaceae bacterium]|jgi:hypothetical protein|nr:hypothetical protein [Holosporaceae bacterium]
MKKIVVLGALFAFVGCAFASDEGVVDSASDSFDGAYFALGLGGNFLENKVSVDKVGSLRQNINKGGGVAAFGGGKTFGNSFYLGGEVLVDFGKSTSKEVWVEGRKIGSTRNRGIIPAIVLRPGFVRNDWMLFLKVGAQFPSLTSRDTANKKMETLSRPGYVIGVGIEKFLSSKFSGRLESEYVSGSQKTYENVKVEAGKGVNLRALIVYNVRY